MSAFDPSDFQDLSQVIAFRQRNNQLDAVNRHLQEVADLKRTLQSQELRAHEENDRRNHLYGLKKAAEEINTMLSSGNFTEAYQLIRAGRDRFSRLGLRQEHFSTIEFKDLAEGLADYFEKVVPYFESITPPELLREIRAREQREEEQKKRAKESLLAKQEHARAQQSKRADQEFKNDMRFVYLAMAVVVGLVILVAWVFSG